MADYPRIWLKSEANFPLVDAESGTRFEPGTAVRAEHTNWVKMQPAIKRCLNPDDDVTEKAQQKIDEQNAADAQARQDRERNAENIQRAANGKPALDEAPAAAPAADTAARA